MKIGKFPKNKKMNIEEAFLASYDECSEQILRHIYFRVNNMALAQDLNSETFLKTWQYLSQGSEIKNLKSFLYKVANNLIIDHYRKKAKEPLVLENLPETGEKESISGDFDQKIDIALIKKELKKLPEEHQKILIYRYVDELSVDEICKIMDKSVVNVYVIIHRALKSLKKNKI